MVCIVTTVELERQLSLLDLGLTKTHRSCVDGDGAVSVWTVFTPELTDSFSSAGLHGADPEPGLGGIGGARTSDLIARNRVCEPDFAAGILFLSEISGRLLVHCGRKDRPTLSGGLRPFADPP